MALFRKLDKTTFVAGQIGLSDIAEAAAMGVTRIVNNRPDGEEPGQPSGAEIEAAARAAGLDYHFVPMAGGLSLPLVEAMADALDGDGIALAYCKSGTRSTYLWALARKRHGADGGALIEAAAAAGYDLSPLAGYLDA